MIQASSPRSTEVTFRSGAGAQDANVFIPLDVAYRHSTQDHQLAPRLKQSPEIEEEPFKRHSDTSATNLASASRGMNRKIFDLEHKA